MNQHQILNGLETFSETVLQNVNVYKANWMVSKNLQRPSTPVPGKYLHFMEWLWKPQDHQNAITVTETDAFEAFQDPPE